MILGFANNIKSTIAADITASQTVIPVMPGAGAHFAKTLQEEASNANDSYKQQVYSKLTLTDSQETVFEICHLMSVNGDNLTVIRGQEGTVAKGWSLNDVVSNFSTRGSENNFVQIEDLQSGKYLSAVAGGTENDLTLAIPSTFYANGGDTFALRMPLIVMPVLTNTGAVTIQLTVSGKVIGTYPLYKGVSKELEAGDIKANIPLVIVFSEKESCFITLNPGKGLLDSNLFLLRSNNLSDVENVEKARENLGLKSAALKDVGTSAGNVMEVGAFGLGRGAKHRDDAYTTVAEIYRITSASNNRPGDAIYGVISLPCDASPVSGYVAVSNDGAGFIGSSQPNNTLKWSRIYTTAYKPSASDVGAYPVTGGDLQGSMNAIGSVLTQGGAFLIRNSDGKQIASVSAKDDGSITVWSDVNGHSFGLNSAGAFYTSAGTAIIEAGQRVYSPNNPPPNTTQLSVSGDGWWYKDLRTGIIFQGGFATGSADTNGAIDRIGLNVAVPNRLLFVSTIIRNYGQGYQTTWNPQTGNLSGERNGFQWIHGSQEREVYWMAVGY